MIAFLASTVGNLLLFVSLDRVHLLSFSHGDWQRAATLIGP
jgi:hypothetical protein